ncbi:hypothetical protein [Celeribacter sp.]|uniref:hypothetical protein n=1 Tax=Celeribacter sp. TaxID=1890673 RepID=UPI003A95C1C3
MTAYELAKSQFDDREISHKDLAENWLDEVKFCYAKHGGTITPWVDFVNPCHWSFNIVRPSKEDWLSPSYGRIILPVLKVHPENAAKALIAYEKAVTGVQS